MGYYFVFLCTQNTGMKTPLKYILFSDYLQLMLFTT